MKTPTIEDLKVIDSFIPKGEGCSSIRLFSDRSWVLEIEFQAIVIADPSSENPKMILWEDLVINANPEWLPDIKEWFVKIESYWNSIM